MKRLQKTIEIFTNGYLAQEVENQDKWDICLIFFKSKAD